MTPKEEWLYESIEVIKSKNLQVPFKLNQCTTVTDLDKYLKVLQASVLHTTKPKVLKPLVNQIEELLNYGLHSISESNNTSKSRRL